MATPDRASLFRERARELREMAPTMASLEARTSMFNMALAYGALALHLEGLGDRIEPSKP